MAEIDLIFEKDLTAFTLYTDILGTGVFKCVLLVPQSTKYQAVSPYSKTTYNLVQAIFRPAHWMIPIWFWTICFTNVMESYISIHSVASIELVAIGDKYTK